MNYIADTMVDECSRLTSEVNDVTLRLRSSIFEISHNHLTPEDYSDVLQLYANAVNYANKVEVLFDKVVEILGQISNVQNENGCDLSGAYYKVENLGGNTAELLKLLVPEIRELESILQAENPDFSSILDKKFFED